MPLTRSSERKLTAFRICSTEESKEYVSTPTSSIEENEHVQVLPGISTKIIQKPKYKKKAKDKGERKTQKKRYPSKNLAGLLRDRIFKDLNGNLGPHPSLNEFINSYSILPEGERALIQYVGNIIIRLNETMYQTLRDFIMSYDEQGWKNRKTWVQLKALLLKRQNPDLDTLLCAIFIEFCRESGIPAWSRWADENPKKRTKETIEYLHLPESRRITESNLLDYLECYINQATITQNNIQGETMIENNIQEETDTSTQNEPNQMDEVEEEIDSFFSL